MVIEKNNFIVLTGGPGSGKTSVLEALQHRGVCCVGEAGREIIQSQVSIGGFALPWDDRRTYRELQIAHALQAFRTHLETAELVVFDRGLVDVIGYSNLIGLSDTQHIQRAIETYRYCRNVLIAPPWEVIYSNDMERKQSFQEAVETHDAMVTAYNKAGYSLVELPLVSVEERVIFILEFAGMAD